MAKLNIETKTSLSDKSSLVCRLCMSKESLSDMYREYGLHQWIEDYLSIMVSVEDSMSKLICMTCRTRLTEFHQFRRHCLSVQGVLLSMAQTSVKHPNNDPNKTPICPRIDLVQLQFRPGRFAPTPILEQIDEPVQCEVCHKMFKTNKQLFNHRRIHGPKKHKCTYCRKSFVRREHLDKHIERKHQEKCELQTQNHSSAETEHSAEASKPELQPVSVKLEPIEPNDDSSDDAPLDNLESKVTDEVEDMIDIEEIKIENRSDCDEEIPSDAPNEASTTEEKSSEHQPFKCDLCPKSFRLKCRLGFHKQHTHGTKQHKCPICGRPFAFQHHMQAHVQTHEPIHERHQNDTDKDNCRSFECDECHKTFKVKKALAHHKRYRHGPKNHECHICGFQFALACRLAKHLRSHSRKRESKEDFQLS